MNKHLCGELLIQQKFPLHHPFQVLENNDRARPRNVLHSLLPVKSLALHVLKRGVRGR